MPDPLSESLIESGRFEGVRRKVGTVTDASVFPPLIDCGGGAVATPCVAGYYPVVNDRVHVIEDWNGKYTGTRLCLGRATKAGGCFLRRVANQSATGGGGTTISWDTEDVDQGGWITVTSTDITVPSTTVYAVHAQATGAGNWAADSDIALLVGGAVLARGTNNRSLATVQTGMTLPLSLGTVITAVVFNNGATQNMTARINVTPV